MHSPADPDIREWLTDRIGAGVRLGLATCAEMLGRLGSPERAFPSVHVAGTNGKGSLCAHLSALGAKNGLLIGLFTSPHLVTVEERARIDGIPVEPEEFDFLLEEVRRASLIKPQIHPTYFEATFLASMLAFAEAGVDRAIIETGLGGRLDSTRLVQADICAITTISLDHTEMLGDSLEQIATEKAGIHREGVPLFCLRHEDDTVRDAIEGVAGRDVIWCSTESTDAQGIARELATAIGQRLGWENLEPEIRWAGRTRDPLEWSGVECSLSAAHNEESLAHDLREIEGERHVMLLGLTLKSDLEKTIAPLSRSTGCILTIVTEVDGGRNPSVPADILVNALSESRNSSVEVLIDPSQAMDRAAEVAREHDCRVYVTGSIHLVGKILGEFVKRERIDLRKTLTIHQPRARTEG
ncbi:MAG: Mur ligase family protein [Candidatus Thermoplasmatota archaeon]|nr:Mur ligase family protein [Candidatus Thermoplasmatota archaeon]MEE2625439.1 Mur ligase family protein [Candidatus Thermoplasmatota archaeon]